MKKLLLPSLGLIASLILSQHTLALTFKTGEVIGPDGKSYVGMSPQNKANMLANTTAGVIKSGVMNGQFYLVYNNQVITVPVTELRNRTSAERMNIIKQAITTQGSVQLSNTTLNTNIGQSPTPTTYNDIDGNHLTSDIDNTTQGVNQEVEHSLNRDIQEANDHLENGLVREVEHSLDHDVENEINDHLESDLEHELNDALDHDVENEINDHLERDDVFDRIDHDDRNESHDDNDDRDDRDDRDDHDD